ncbi:MAG: hypothetical protein MUF18_09350 [Fimbriiglobus sp.]|jgi:hypothetical protein|nr:hypothetical protein [Fimbriiglobus sp.]
MAKKKKKADDEKPKKKKASRPIDDEDEGEEEEYSPDAASKPSLDIYVGLSAITLLVLIAAAVFFYLDADKTKAAPQAVVTLGPLQGGGAARPPAGPAGMPGPANPGQ